MLPHLGGGQLDEPSDPGTEAAQGCVERVDHGAFSYGCCGGTGLNISLGAAASLNTAACLGAAAVISISCVQAQGGDATFAATRCFRLAARAGRPN